MNRWGFWIAIVVLFLVCRLSGTWLGPRIGVDPGVVMLSLLVGVYAVVAAAVAVQRRRLARWFEQGPPDQAALRISNPELKYGGAHARRTRSARWAIRIGVAWVNVPVLPLIVGPLALYQYFSDRDSNALGAALLLAGFVAAWAWWSVNVTLWRAWATRRGVDPDELQWRGQEAQLLWPQGHFFERTELAKILLSIRKRRLTRL